MPTHITVTAPAGRQTPIHPSDGSEPGGGLLYVVPGVVCRVRFSQSTRRAIARTDLLSCDMDGAPCTVALADAPEELPGGKIIIAERVAQRPPRTSKVTP